MVSQPTSKHSCTDTRTVVVVSLATAAPTLEHSRMFSRTAIKVCVVYVERSLLSLSLIATHSTSIAVRRCIARKELAV